MANARPDIHLHIERLVLDGLALDQAQGSHVQAAVEAELARLLTESGIGGSLAGGGALPSVRAGSIQLAPGGTPAELGIQIAQSVFGGIGSTR